MKDCNCTRKVLFVATVVRTHIMQFHIPYLKIFKDEGWETAVAARNDYEDFHECSIPYCDRYYDIPVERNPLKLNNIRAYLQLKRIIEDGDYDIIHCHTPVGAAITRLAAAKARKNGSRVFYTAHGFHFFNGAPGKNWLVFYPIERALAHKTDVLITINKEDYQRAKRFKAGSIKYIPGVGIDTERFKPDRSKRNIIRKELEIPEDNLVLLTVGELIPRKNYGLIMDALKRLNDEKKLSKVKYLICGSGYLEKELQDISIRFGLSDNISFLGYRNDIDRIYQAADIFIFMSLQEGLPVALIEAMASGLPVVCSLIRGNADLVDNGVNGCIIQNDAVLLANKLYELLSCEVLREKYRKAAQESVYQYDLKKVTQDYRQLYGFKER